MLLPEKSNLLLVSWKNPFTVMKRLNKVNCPVKIGNKHKTYHINILKRFLTRPTYLISQNEADPEIGYTGNITSSTGSAVINDTYENEGNDDIFVLSEVLKKEIYKDVI